MAILHPDDAWKIIILTDAVKGIITLCTDKNKSVADLFQGVRTTRKDLEGERLAFYVTDAVQLEEGDKRRLVEVYELRNGCHIQLLVGVVGGGWPTELEVLRQIRDPTKAPSLEGRITSDIPDVMGLEEKSPRVKMCCGHAIAPSSLAFLCYHQLKNGADSIRCPNADCQTVWSFKLVIDAACLTLNETKEFELKMISNGLNMRKSKAKKCPGCETYCRRLDETPKRIRCRVCTSAKGKLFDFCWACQKEWQDSSSTSWCGNLGCEDYKLLVDCLATCETKQLNGIECPTRRACPSCLMIVAHKDQCKKMTCPNKSCNNYFCFICLEHNPCATGPYTACKPAPRQQLTSSRPPPRPPPRPEGSNCTIL